MVAPLERLQEKYTRELVVIGVHSGKFTTELQGERIEDAVRRLGITHPVVNDKDYAIWQAYAARAWPSLYFIDPRGKIIGVSEGEVDFESLDRFVGRLVDTFRAEGLLDAGPPPLLTTAAEGLPPATRPGPTELLFPGGVAADPTTGRLALADTGHHRILLLRPDGQVEAVIGSGQEGLQDGEAGEARFRRPQGLLFHGSALYVADTGNHAVRQVQLPTGRVVTLAGTGRKGDYRPLAQADPRQVALRSPWDVEVWGDELLIAMAGSHQIWALRLDGSGLRVWAGTGHERLDDGPALRATFSQPSGLSRHGDYVYVADAESSAIRRLHLPRGWVDTLVGVGLFDWGDRDGVGTQARLQHPQDVVAAGDVVYIADTYNHKVKRLEVATRRVESLWGDGQPGWQDGVGAEARFREPAALALAGDSLYVADTGNHRLRRVDLRTGAVTTINLRGPA